MDANAGNFSQEEAEDGNNTETGHGDASVTLVVQVITMVMVDLIAICGNVSVIYIIIRTPQLRTISHLFVLNLCFVDLLAAVLVLPVSIATVAAGEWVFGEAFCRANGFFNAFCTFASISTLGAISIDRYYSIAKPMEYAAKVTPKRVVFSLAYIWIQSSALAAAPLVGWSEFSYSPSRANCSFDWTKTGYHIFYIAVIGTLCFALPAALIVVMYCGIYRVARRAARQIGPVPSVADEGRRSTVAAAPNTPQNGGGDASTVSDKTNCATMQTAKFSSKQRNHRAISMPSGTEQASSQISESKPKSPVCSSEFKAVRTLLLIVGIFLLLWTPYFAVHIHVIIHRYADAKTVLERASTWIAYLSFAVNPFIYGWLNRQLRQELIRSMKTCPCCCKDNAQNETENHVAEEENFFQFLERTSGHTTTTATKSTAGKDPSAALPEKIVELSEMDTFMV